MIRYNKLSFFDMVLVTNIVFNKDGYYLTKTYIVTSIHRSWWLSLVLLYKEHSENMQHNSKMKQQWMGLTFIMPQCPLFLL